MRKVLINNWLFLVLLCYVWLQMGCTPLVFNKQMPESAKNVQRLPDYMLGDFIAIYYDSNKLNCQWNQVVEISTGKYAATNYGIEYLDSAKLDSLGIDRIDSVYLSNKQLHVSTNKQKLVLELSDSIRMLKIEKTFDLDLKEGFYMDDFKDSVKREAVLKQNKKDYYLNVRYKETPYWYIRKIQNFPTYLYLTSTEGISDTVFKANPDFAKDLNIKLINDTVGGNKYYLADVNDKDFYKLMQQPDLLSDEIWYKIMAEDPAPNKWRLLLIVSAFFVVLAILFGWFKLRTKKLSD